MTRPKTPPTIPAMIAGVLGSFGLLEGSPSSDGAGSGALAEYLGMQV